MFSSLFSSLFGKNFYSSIPPLPDVIRNDLKYQYFDEQNAYNEMGERFEKLVEGETTGFECYLGAIYNLGQNMSKAKKWFKRGADRGDIMCVCYLGYLFYWSEGKHAEGEAYIRQAADAGFVPAQASLGVIYFERKNLPLAKEWLLKGAKLDHAPAHTSLGEVYEAEGNISEAKKWFAKAANQGEPDGMFFLARILHSEGDMAGAQSWYMKTAKYGNMTAQTNLGIVFAVQGNMAAAKEWWEKAAKQGSASACDNLARAFMMEGDVREAEKWTKQAESGAFKYESYPTACV